MGKRLTPPGGVVLLQFVAACVWCRCLRMSGAAFVWTWLLPAVVWRAVVPRPALLRLLLLLLLLLPGGLHGVRRRRSCWQPRSRGGNRWRCNRRQPMCLEGSTEPEAKDHHASCC